MLVNILLLWVIIISGSAFPQGCERSRLANLTETDKQWIETSLQTMKLAFEANWDSSCRIVSRCNWMLNNTMFPDSVFCPKFNATVGISESAYLSTRSGSDVSHDICATCTLDPYFTQTFSTLTGSIYIGTNSGVFRLYPAQTFEHPHYVPLLHPWYVSAISGPKNLVIIVDTSALDDPDQSNQVWDAINDTVNGVLSTMSPADYVSVLAATPGGVITPWAAQCASCYANQLVRATLQTTCRMARFFNTYVSQSGGVVDFQAAFSQAQQMLDKQHQYFTGNQCPDRDIIIFITNGISSNQASQIRSALNAADTKLFIYSSATEGDEMNSILLTCEYNGIYDRLSSEDNNPLQVVSTISSYYGSGNDGSVVWTPLYYDLAGSGWILTASVPCFTWRDYQRVVAVIAVDVPLNQSAPSLNSSYATNFKNCSVLDEMEANLNTLCDHMQEDCENDQSLVVACPSIHLDPAVIDVQRPTFAKCPVFTPWTTTRDSFTGVCCALVVVVAGMWIFDIIHGFYVSQSSKTEMQGKRELLPSTDGTNSPKETSPLLNNK